MDYDKEHLIKDIFQRVVEQLGTGAPVPVVKLQRLIESAAEKEITLMMRFMQDDVDRNRNMLLSKLIDWQRTRAPVTLNVMRHAADEATYSYDRR